ncbi:MAG TPA: MobA/MobL family protein [Steroidobacteraceae bacterium]|nr:MobA/MobL family protein [Steroidobacteraceae bacterium]
MAIYYFGVKSFGRAAGTSGMRSTSGAAYRAGERIRDERTGIVYDHTDRVDVMYKEVLLPEPLQAEGASMDWARDRAVLWNAAEHAESRSNARVAREYAVALPHELTHEGRVQLARGFAQEIATRYESAVDLAIHAPRGDPRNFHAHLLSTTREISVAGFGAKTAAELGDSQRASRGLVSGRAELIALRERWADLTNQALRDAGVAARVSHLSLKAQGITREPRLQLPRAAYQMERRGTLSIAGERARALARDRLREDPSTKVERIRAAARERWLESRRAPAETRESDSPEQKPSIRKEPENDLGK